MLDEKVTINPSNFHKHPRTRKQLKNTRQANNINFSLAQWNGNFVDEFQRPIGLPCVPKLKPNFWLLCILYARSTLSLHKAQLIVIRIPFTSRITLYFYISGFEFSIKRLSGPSQIKRIHCKLFYDNFNTSNVNVNTLNIIFTVTISTTTHTVRQCHYLQPAITSYLTYRQGRYARVHTYWTMFAEDRIALLRSNNISRHAAFKWWGCLRKISHLLCATTCTVSV